MEKISDIDKIEVIEALFESGCVMVSESADFILNDGTKSYTYYNLRRLRSFPTEKALVADVFIKMLRRLDFDLLADVPTAMTPVVSSISDKLYIPQITPRFDISRIDGAYRTKNRVALIDDVFSKGATKLKAAALLQANGLEVVDILALIDRESGGKEELIKRGFRPHSLISQSELLAAGRDLSFINQQLYTQIILSAQGLCEPTDTCRTCF